MALSTFTIALEIQRDSGKLVGVYNAEVIGPPATSPIGKEKREWIMKDIIIDAVGSGSTSRTSPCGQNQCGVTINGMPYCFDC